MGAFGSLMNRLGWRKAGVPFKRHYLGARHDRLTGDWMASVLSPDAELWSNRRTLVARSRELCRDNPHAASLARVWVENKIGPNGLQHFPLSENRDGVLNLRANDRLSDWWEAWGQRGNCTLDGRHSWYDVERLIGRADFVDGEFLALYHEGPDVNEYGFALQLLDPDQLDDTLTMAAGKDHGEIRMGVEVDRFGRPQFYHIWDRHPYDIATTRGERRRIPADRVLHYFEAWRPGQTRGFPRLTPVMYQLNMLRGYDEASLVASRLAACAAFVFEQNIEGPTLEDDAGDPIGEIPDDMEPGERTLLPKGVTAKMVQPSHPGNNYESATKKWLRDIGAGAGVAYHTFTGDLSDTNFTSGRMGENQQRDMFRGQHNRLASGVHVPIRTLAMKNSMLSGALSLAPDDWRQHTAVRFAGRGWDFVKPSEDINAAAMKIALRLDSRQNIASQYGLRIEDVLRANKADQDLAAKIGVDMPDPLPMGIQATTTPDESGTPKGGANDGTSTAQN